MFFAHHCGLDEYIDRGAPARLDSRNSNGDIQSHDFGAISEDNYKVYSSITVKQTPQTHKYLANNNNNQTKPWRPMTTCSAGINVRSHEWQICSAFMKKCFHTKAITKLEGFEVPTSSLSKFFY